MVKILNEKIIHYGKVFDVVQADLEFDNGNKATYEVMQDSEQSESNCGVMAVALDDEMNIYLVEEYQIGCNSNLLLLPRGGIEKNETPEECMQKELQEESGIKAGKLTRLTEIHPIPGYLRFKTILFLAEELSPSKLDTGDEPESLNIYKIPLQEAIEKILTGEIIDARTIAGILFVNEYIGR